MPIVRVVQGDLLEMFEEKEFDGIAHGCNCYHAMASGIAGQIAQRYPVIAETDRKTKVGEDKLGTFSMHVLYPQGAVYNLYTQTKPGRESQPVLTAAIRAAFLNLDRLFENIKHRALYPKIGIPKIGCGIAGGSWAIVEKVINASTPHMDITVVEYDPNAVKQVPTSPVLEFSYTPAKAVGWQDFVMEDYGRFQTAKMAKEIIEAQPMVGFAEV